MDMRLVGRSSSTVLTGTEQEFCPTDIQSVGQSSPTVLTWIEQDWTEQEFCATRLDSNLKSVIFNLLIYCSFLLRTFTIT